ncbi:MAG: class IV aminotransferase [Bryobacterales bacterium]|nr:class IV aminotransferase [Bryobacterales bacterium]
MHRFILHNENVCEASEKSLSTGQTGLLTGWGVFSTIRVMDGVLFAWERHWARMTRDARLLRVPMPADANAVETKLYQLIEANGAANSTLRLSVVRNAGGIWTGPDSGRECDLIAFTASTKVWGAGVRLTYVPQARHAACVFAGTKILAWAMNLTWLEQAQSRGFDEALLLNERGEVSECTSANIFIAEGNQAYTPPLASGCLPGITRELLLGEIHVAGYRVNEKTLFPADLEGADEVFITSTTRELLAVNDIDGRPIRNHGGARQALGAAFQSYENAYVQSRLAVSH